MRGGEGPGRSQELIRRRRSQDKRGGGGGGGGERQGRGTRNRGEWKRRAIREEKEEGSSEGRSGGGRSKTKEGDEG